MKNKGIIQNIVIVLLIIGILVFGYLYFEKPKIIYQDKLIEDNRAILDVDIDEWGKYIYNSDEILFDYWLYNYGNSEANNVKVECKIFDINYNLISSVLDNVGNIASHSASFKEIEKIQKIYNVSNNIGICYIKSCDNCKILYKEIPELVKNLEKE